jgi:hypothetical protein
MRFREKGAYFIRNLERLKIIFETLGSALSYEDNRSTAQEMCHYRERGIVNAKRRLLKK